MDIKLLLNNLFLSFIKRTKTKNNKKCRAAWLMKGYVDLPTISFIIQSHNKSLQVIHILKKLKEVPRAEIIVIDDGSDTIHTDRLVKELTGANEFLIRANDLYEIIMYDKAIRFSNGQYIALLQDDDDFDNLKWVDDAIMYFEKYPDMVILGGRDGGDFHIDEKEKKAYGIEYADKNEGLEFRFVHQVNRAPMWFRKDLFLEKLHHMDMEFAPFQFDDTEICLRAWLKGLSVGWYKANFKSLSVGGMRIWNSAFTDEQIRINIQRLHSLYKNSKNEISNNINHVINSENSHYRK